MPILSIRSGTRRGAEFQFEEPIVIGRGGTAGLTLADTSVSRRHARIVSERGRWSVEDLGSANGTFLNDRRLSQRAPISSGDTLRVGNVLLKYQESTRLAALIVHDTPPAGALATDQPGAAIVTDPPIVTDPAIASNLTIAPDLAIASDLAVAVNPSASAYPGTAAVSATAGVPAVPRDQAAMIGAAGAGTGPAAAQRSGNAAAVEAERIAGSGAQRVKAEPDTRQQVILRVSAEAAAQSLTASARQSRAVASLARISSMVFDERALLSFVVDELLEALTQAERAFVMLWDQEFDRFVPMASRLRSGESGAPVGASETLLRDVLARKEAVLVANLQSDRKYGTAESIRALKLQSAICAPILFQDDIFGVVQVDSSSGGSPFDRGDVSLTMAFASEIGMALAYARLHAKLLERESVERDLGLARKIQHHFLPQQVPAVPGYRFAVHYRPALAVGGDLFDFVDLGSGCLAVGVGDVSGKGISAALFGAKVVSDLRCQAAGQTRPASILHRLNQALASSDHEGMLVTLALIVLDPAAGRLAVASGGHPLPFVRDANGTIMPMGRASDQPLGLDRAAQFTQYEYEVDPGDTFLLYTDGVIEALNPGNQPYGEPRLAKTIGAAPATPDEIVKAIAADVRTFAFGHPQGDDVTVVCFDRPAS